MFLFIITFHSWSLERPLGPTSLFTYAKCDVQQSCELYVSITNKTSYNIKLRSNQFDADGVNINATQVYDLEKYVLLERKGQSVDDAKVELRNAKSKSNNHNPKIKKRFTLEIKPYERKEYKLRNLEGHYDFKAGRSYIINLYFLAVDVLVDDVYADSPSMTSKFSELHF